MTKFERFLGAGLLTAAVGLGAYGGDFLKGKSAEGAYQPNATFVTPRVNEAGASPTPINLDATPTPNGSEAPAPTPPYEILNGGEGQFTIPMGTSMELPANTVVVGDALTINGLRWTDSDAISGLLTVLKEPAIVAAGSTWSVDFLEVRTPEEAQRLALAKYNDLQLGGCGLPDGCERTDILEFPGDMQGVQASHYDEYVAGSPVEPTPTPDASEIPMPDYQALLDEMLALDPETLTLDQKLELAQLRILVEIQKCTCSTDACVVHPSPTPSMTPTPTVTPSPEVCPTDSVDIEHAYTGWNNNGFDRSKAPKESGTIQRAIFQSDGAWRFDGQGSWNSSYDNSSNTALIYVYEFDTPRTVEFSYDWGGDLQAIPECPSADTIQDTILQRDIEQTLARPEVTEVKVVYVSADGSTRSEVLR